MICFWINAGCRGPTRPNTAANWAAAIGARYHRANVVTNFHRPGRGADFGTDFLCISILGIENCVQLSPNLIEREILVFCAQIADEHGRIMTNLREIVIVLLAVGMPGLHSIDVLLQLCLQLGIVGIRFGDLNVICRPGGCGDRCKHSTGNHRT